MTDEQVENIPEAFAAVVELGLALGAAPLNKFHACWECDIDDQWHISFNGHRETKKSRDGLNVPAFTLCVTFNGFPAGLIDPRGGVLAAGEAANEETFLAAVAKKRAEASS